MKDANFTTNEMNLYVPATGDGAATGASANAAGAGGAAKEAK